MTLESKIPGRRPAGYLLFMIVLGSAGWALLCLATFRPGFGPNVPSSVGVLPFTLFLLVVIPARIMAFDLLPRTIVSLDSGFYVAASVCLGSVAAGRLIALALTVDALLRVIGNSSVGGDRNPDRIESIAYVAYIGGMSGALLMVIAWVFRVDSIYALGSFDEVEVLGRVIGVGLTLLVSHYALQGLRLRLIGQSFGDFVRRTTIRGVLTEASLLPLAAVIVFIYHPARPLGFILLGATYLIMNFAFSRLSRTSAKLHQRVSELEILNVTAHRLAASLQLHELVEVVARETMAAIPAAEMLTLTHRPGGDDPRGLVVDYYDRSQDKFKRIHLEQPIGATARVLADKESLLIADLGRSDFSVHDGESSMRSWMGVPVIIYGKAEGVLAIQSRRRGAFGADEMRLLEAIGAQAAVALQNAHLYELAMIDGLTRLYVRRYLDARLAEEIQRCHRFETVFSVVMMDIDDFKSLNDTYGHQAGDRVLRKIAEIVRHQMRGVDTAARYGGEEFAMVLPRTGMLEAYNQAERIRGEIAECRVNLDGKVIGTTASFGIAAFPESGATDAEELMELADRALYRAKKTGKNRVELYWPDDRAGDRRSIRTAGNG